MAGVTSLLIALCVSLIITRIAALALMFTGLSREAARFQARSAFSGVGFTTREAENIVNHPVRRRIVMILMLLGNVGVATVIATIMLSVTDQQDAPMFEQLQSLAMLATGLLAIWMVFTSRWVERQMNKLIAWALKRFTDLDVRDYVSLLQLADGYSVTEMLVEPKSWIAGRELKQLRLSDEGILILGINRPAGGFQGIPRATDVIETGDTLILYGNIKNIRELDRRRAGKSGDQEHQIRVQEQVEKEAEEAEARKQLEKAKTSEEVQTSS